MKHLSLFAILFISFLFSPKSYGQNAIPLSDCVDSAIIHQADSIRDQFTRQGFVLLKETSVGMESQYELPIVLPLDRGVWYQFIFIGDPSSVLYEVRIYDADEKQIVYQKKSLGDADYNMISYSFIPDDSQYYMIKPLQVNKKKKKMCGYVMLLKRTR
ncbi:MAG TPA: hypothetical protein VK705_03895 [Ferruginibacter sp.]|jgi:hypothetical protein|nr:hypothetical protein [Ferruginibacter sp.]